MRPGALIGAIVLSFCILLLSAGLLGVFAWSGIWLANRTVLGIVGWIAVFVGGTYMGYSHPYRVWLSGSLLGILFFLLLTVLSRHWSNTEDWLWLGRFFFSGLTGFAGAFLGGMAVLSRKNG